MISAISRAIELPVDDLDSSSGLGITPEWDSFGHLRIILELESEFSVRFDMERIPDLKNFELIEQELRSLGVG